MLSPFNDEYFMKQAFLEAQKAYALAAKKYHLFNSMAAAWTTHLSII